ncbi:retrovirus-related pol polyprotein from transposon TNT 1-94, partial [Tanacetum coccineum]
FGGCFRKHSCYVRDTDGVELLKGSRGSNLYTISVKDMMKSSSICLLSKASKNKSWLWHRRLNHLNFVQEPLLIAVDAWTYRSGSYRIPAPSYNKKPVAPLTNKDLEMLFQYPSPKTARFQALQRQSMNLIDFGRMGNKNKARLVAKGFRQDEGRDFEESLRHPGCSLKKNPMSPTEGFVNPERHIMSIGPEEKHFNVKQAPRASRTKLDEDLSGIPVDQTKYRSMIGSLMYLTASRPDLVFAVCMCARYQSRPTKKAPDAVNRVLRLSGHLGRSTSGIAQIPCDNLSSGHQRRN